jgi:hypothetical protein
LAFTGIASVKEALQLEVMEDAAGWTTKEQGFVGAKGGETQGVLGIARGAHFLALAVRSWRKLKQEWRKRMWSRSDLGPSL